LCALHTLFPLQDYALEKWGERDHREDLGNLEQDVARHGVLPLRRRGLADNRTARQPLGAWRLNGASAQYTVRAMNSSYMNTTKSSLRLEDRIW
jgi:hypothetical protein